MLDEVEYTAFHVICTKMPCPVTEVFGENVRIRHIYMSMFYHIIIFY